MDPRVLYIHPHNHLMPSVIPVGAIGAINSLRSGAVGRYAHEVTREDLEAAQVVLLDVHWFFPLPTLDAIFKRIRTIAPHARIVVGGLTASFYRTLVRERWDPDYVVYGHAEASLAVLVEALLAGATPPPLPNVGARGAPFTAPVPLSQEAFDAIDWLTIDWFPSFARAVRERHTQRDGPGSGWGDAYPHLLVTRGCPRRCDFCYGAFQREVFGPQVLRRSPARVLEDLRRIEASPLLDFVSLYVGDVSSLGPYAAALAGQRIELDVTVFCCGAPEVAVMQTIESVFAGSVAWSVIQPTDLAPLSGGPADASARFDAFLHHIQGHDRSRSIVWHVSEPDPRATAAASAGGRVLTASGVDWRVKRPDIGELSDDYSLADQFEDVLSGARRTAAALLLAGTVPTLQSIPVKAFGQDDVFNPINEGPLDELEEKLVRQSVRNMLERRFYGFDDLELAWGLNDNASSEARWSACGEPVEGSASWSLDAQGLAWTGEVSVENAVPVEVTLLPSVLVAGADPIPIRHWSKARVPGVPIQPGPRRQVEVGGRLLEDGVELWTRDRGQHRTWTVTKRAVSTGSEVGVLDGRQGRRPAWAEVTMRVIVHRAKPIDIELRDVSWSGNGLTMSLRMGAEATKVTVILREKEGHRDPFGNLSYALAGGMSLANERRAKSFLDRCLREAQVVALRLRARRKR